MNRTPATTYRIMSAIKSKDTVPEKLLAKAMWQLGLRYRKHYNLPGHPDFVFVKAKIAVFCDGDFWHGNNWKLRGLDSFNEELATYTPFWANKIKCNVDRDSNVSYVLKERGWLVLRFWESDIRKAPDKFANKIYKTYRKRLKSR